MAINIEEAQGFEEFGWKAVDANGDVQFYFTFGSGSPVGIQAPVPTIYIQKEDSSIWRKFGPLSTDWVQSDAGGDLCIGGAGANYIYTPPQCVGGGDANGN